MNDDKLAPGRMLVFAMLFSIPIWIVIVWIILLIIQVWK